MREARGLADPVVVDPIVGDVGLVGERRPSAEHERILTHGLHGLRQVDGHESARHLGVGLGLGVVLGAPEVAQVLGQQLTAAHATAVVVQVVVDEVGVAAVDARVLVVLILGPVARVVLVEHIVVVDQGVGRAREEVQEELLDLDVEDALNFVRVVEVPAFRLQMRQCDPQLVHALRAVGREPGVVLLHAARVAEHLRKVEATATMIALVAADGVGLVLACRVAPQRVGRDDGIGRVFVDGVAQRQRYAAFRGFDVVLADVGQALVVFAEPEPPLGLDRARRCGLQQLDDGIAGAFGDLRQSRLGGGLRAGIAVPVQHHVGAPAVVGERRRLSLR